MMNLLVGIKKNVSKILDRSFRAASLAKSRKR